MTDLVKDVPLLSLHPAEWNPRSIKNPRFQNLCRSIEADPEFLQHRPILAMADGTIYAGNMRWRAAQHLGMGTVPAIVEDIPKQLAKERAMRDNAQWGEWEEDSLAKLLDELKVCGSDLDLLGFEERELRNLLNKLSVEGGLTDPDAVLPLPDEPVTKTGHLWLLGDHRLLCGDSTDPHDVGFVMNGEKAKLLCTDPPYLVDYDGTNRLGADGLNARGPGWDEYQGAEPAVAFFVDYLRAAFSHLDAKCPVYQWFGDMRTKEVMRAWEVAGLTTHQVVVWVKTRGLLGRRHFMWQHESCLYGWREGGMPRLKPPANETSVWHVDQLGETKEDHPTQKPVELFKRPMLWHLKPGEVAFEPFSGSGTAIIAAETTRRRCYAIEKEAAYVDVAVSRWESFTGRKAELVAKDATTC